MDEDEWTGHYQDDEDEFDARNHETFGVLEEYNWEESQALLTHLRVANGGGTTNGFWKGRHEEEFLDRNLLNNLGAETSDEDNESYKYDNYKAVEESIARLILEGNDSDLDEYAETQQFTGLGVNYTVPEVSSNQYLTVEEHDPGRNSSFTESTVWSRNSHSTVGEKTPGNAFSNESCMAKTQSHGAKFPCFKTLEEIEEELLQNCQLTVPSTATSLSLPEQSNSRPVVVEGLKRDFYEGPPKQEPTQPRFLLAQELERCRPAYVVTSPIINASSLLLGAPLFQQRFLFPPPPPGILLPPHRLQPLPPLLHPGMPVATLSPPLLFPPGFHPPPGFSCLPPLPRMPPPPPSVQVVSNRAPSWRLPLNQSVVPKPPQLSVSDFPPLSARPPVTASEKRKHEKVESNVSSVDRYQGLMTEIDKQTLRNIQAIQLKNDHPFTTDYYSLMHKVKKVVLGGEIYQKRIVLLKKLYPKRDQIQTKQNFMPEQYENALGKLQVVSALTPRRVIDTVICLSECSKVAPRPGTNKAHRYLLLEIEKLYECLLMMEEADVRAILLYNADEEDCLGMRRNSDKLGRMLKDSQKLTRILSVTKGKMLICRFLPFTEAALRYNILAHLLNTFSTWADAEMDKKAFPSLRQCILRAEIWDLLIIFEQIRSNRVFASMVVTKLGISIMTCIYHQAEKLLDNSDPMRRNDLVTLWTRNSGSGILAILLKRDDLAEPIEVYPNLIQHIRRFAPQKKDLAILESILKGWLKPGVSTRL